MRTRTEGVGGSGGRSWLVAPAQGPSSSCRQLLGLLSACSWPPGRGTGGAWRGDTSALSWRSERHTTGQHRDGLRTDITGRSRTAVPEQPLCPSGRKTLAGRAQARAHAWVLGSWRSVPGKPHEDAVSRRDGSMEQPLGGVAGGQSGPRAPCEGAWGRGGGRAGGLSCCLPQAHHHCLERGGSGLWLENTGWGPGGCPLPRPAEGFASRLEGGV